MAGDNDSQGFARGLTNYGDRDFALYLRRSFASSMGYSGEMLSRPVVGIAWSPSDDDDVGPNDDGEEEKKDDGPKKKNTPGGPVEIPGTGGGGG